MEVAYDLEQSAFTFEGVADGDLSKNSIEIVSWLYLDCMVKTSLKRGMDSDKVLRALIGDLIDGESATAGFKCICDKYPFVNSMGMVSSVNRILDSLVMLS